MRILFAALTLLVLLGCGESSDVLTPVQGRVLYRGQPLTAGTVVFTPDSERGGKGPQAWAEINSEGYFRLFTEGKRGVVSGWHRITISGIPSDSLPARYRDPELSGQRFEVIPDRANVCELHLD